MVGGNSIMFYQIKPRQSCDGTSGRSPTISASRETIHSNELHWGHRSAEWTPQPWIQEVWQQTVENGRRCLGEQFHVIDAAARSWIDMQLSSVVCENKRDMAVRCGKEQSLCFFASISSSFKDDQLQSKVENVKTTAQKAAENLRVPVPEAKVAGVGPSSLMLKQLLCGTAAGAVASFAASPFQVWRTKVVAGQGGNTASEVLQNEGVQSFLSGNFTVSLLATSLQKGIQFATFEAVKSLEQKEIGGDAKLISGLPRKLPMSTVAGAVAGLTSTLVTYPLQTILDRMFLQPSTYSSIFQSAKKVIVEDGIRELYRGVVPGVIRMVPQTAIGFYSYEEVNKKLQEQGIIPNISSLTAGAVAGLISTGLTYPIEAIRKQISVSAVPASQSATTYNTIGQAMNCIFQHEGLAGFYRGFPVDALEVVPVTAISFLVYELAKRTFVAKHDERRDEVKA